MAFIQLTKDQWVFCLGQYKKDYLNAMKKSPLNSKPIYKLINSSLTDKTNDRELFMKGIDYSYYYEEID